MDIDRALKSLGELPTPDLSRIDGVQIARSVVEERRKADVAMSLAMVAALFTGLLTSTIPSSRAENSIVPFGPPMTLTSLVQLGRG